MSIDYDLRIPDAYLPLLKPKRYKIFKSGRGAAKSWSFARALLGLGIKSTLRICCGRETMKSIEDSVHALLEDQIKALGLDAEYRVQKKTILGNNGTEIIFTGLRDQTAASMKSLEGVDIFWWEEAQNGSKYSWRLLRPTIRKPGSEIWVSYNPELETDETHRIAMDPPEDAIVVHTSWRDNPWFNETTMPAERAEALHKLADAEYRHIWEGECRPTVEGAIFGREMKEAMEQGRICPCPYDRTKPVDTFWDLGFGDLMAIGFVQHYGGYFNFIDYIEDNGRTIESYIMELQDRKYVYRHDYLPHDALDTIIHQKLAAGDRSRSIERLMREAGRQVRLIPKMYVTDGINAARTMLPLVRFDEEKAYGLVRALRFYQWGPPVQKRTAAGYVTEIAAREPLHDRNSHGADMFRGAALTMKYPEGPKPKEPRQPMTPPRVGGNYTPFG